MKWITKMILLSLVFFNFNVSASPPEHPDFDINAAGSVDEAIASITTTLKKQRFEVLGVIDHQQNAANVGLELRPTQLVIFRYRTQEKSLTRRSSTAAIDLPFKILVYEDDNGNIKFKTNDIGYYIDRHKIPLRHSRLQLLDNTLDQFGMNDSGLIFVKSKQSVEDTIAKLRFDLEAAGFFIAFQIDYSRHKQLPSRLLIFGNPNVGTLLMQNRQEIGLDLPQKFLVFEDRQGQVHIVYNDPRFIAQRAGIQGLDTLLMNITNALARFAQQGSKP